MTEFDSAPVLKYLGLPQDYAPSPKEDPLAFLRLHLAILPQSLLESFSSVVSPRQRTLIPLVKNRRTQYALNYPSELGWDYGRSLEPLLWDSFNSSMQTSARTVAPRPGVEAANQEREWAEKNFVGFVSSDNSGPTSGQSGQPHPRRGQVGRLGDLLAEYEEEREAERLRMVRRERAAVAAAEREAEEEFDSESGDEDEDEDSSKGALNTLPDESETPDEIKRSFERLLRERFIGGLLSVGISHPVDRRHKH